MEKNSDKNVEQPPQQIKRKRGRPRTKEPRPVDALPKKRGRKPKPKDETQNQPKKTKKKFDKKVWKAADFSLSIMTHEPIVKKEIILEIPINMDKIGTIDENGEQLLSDSKNFKIQSVSDPNELFMKKIKPEMNKVIERKETFDELIEQRHGQDEEIETRLEYIDEIFPNSIESKKPKYPISPPKYNPEIDFNDINIKDLKMVKGFNDDDVIILDDDITDRDIQFVTFECSDSSSSNSKDDDNEKTKVFDYEITKRPKKPGETKIDKLNTPKFKTKMPEHIPFTTSLINTGIIYKEIYTVLPELYDFTYGKDKDWPEKTNMHCWWDTHSFDTVPIPAPLDYSKNLKKFKIYGCFCSFNCALSHCLETNSQNTSLTSFFYTKWVGKKIKIKKAPPRQCLDIYGGTMTIEEFRESFTTMTKVQLINPPAIPQTQKIEFSFVRPLIDPKTTVLDSNNNLEDVSQMIPETKLKRTKPLRRGKASIASQFSKT